MQNVWCSSNTLSYKNSQNSLTQNSRDRRKTWIRESRVKIFFGDTDTYIVSFMCIVLGLQCLLIYFLSRTFPIGQIFYEALKFKILNNTDDFWRELESCSGWERFSLKKRRGKTRARPCKISAYQRNELNERWSWARVIWFSEALVYTYHDMDMHVLQQWICKGTRK